jgi:hypothetical protein
MNKRLKLDVELEEVRVGNVKEFIQRDIVKVRDGQNVRDVRAKISIKTSKLNAIWLDIGNQIGHSDFFIFMKIGLKTDHYPTYMKESGAVELLLKEAVSAGEIPKERFEEAKKEFEKAKKSVEQNKVDIKKEVSKESNKKAKKEKIEKEEKEFEKEFREVEEKRSALRKVLDSLLEFIYRIFGQ